MAAIARNNVGTALPLLGMPCQKKFQMELHWASDSLVQTDQRMQMAKKRATVRRPLLILSSNVSWVVPRVRARPRLNSSSAPTTNSRASVIQNMPSCKKIGRASGRERGCQYG